MARDEAYEDYKAFISVLLNRIERLGAGQNLRTAGSLADRNVMEAARLAEHGHERRDFLEAVRELKEILGKLGLI